MRWRQGRHNEQLIYEQNGDEPSDDDELVVVCLYPELAPLIVRLANGEPLEEEL